MNKKSLYIPFLAFLAAIVVAATLIVLALLAEPSIPILETEPTSQADVVAAPDLRLEEAVRQNADTVAWLTIPGTSIDGPVLQGADNDYYLRRNDLGETDYHGCIFADYESRMTSASDMSRNTVLYGHTFSDGYTGGFYDLAQYRDSEWANQHREIYLSVADAMLQYEVISVGIADINEGTLPIYCNVNDAEYTEILNLAHQRNEIEFDGDDAAEDANKILTLATCTGDSTERLVVVCRLEG